MDFQEPNHSGKEFPKMASITEDLPVDEAARIERARRYRREMTRSSHEIHGRRLHDNQECDQHTRYQEKNKPVFGLEMLAVQQETALEKALQKGSAGWERIRGLTKKLVQLRYGDYFKQNVAVLRAIAKEDMSEEAAQEIATFPWKLLSGLIKKEEQNMQVNGLKEAVQAITKKTNMSEDLAFFNIHQYAESNQLADSGIYEYLHQKRFGSLGKQIWSDRVWLDANAFAVDACDKEAIIQSIDAFEARVFRRLKPVTNDTNGEPELQELILSEEQLKISEMLDKKADNTKTAKIRQVTYEETLAKTKSLSEDFPYAPLRHAREDLLNADSNAEVAIVIHGKLMAEMEIAIAKVRKTDIAKKKQAERFEKVYKEAQEALAEVANE
ncbi:hypothetical protein HYFRA_00006594 [Hymenoscyphus fraxineus]|uniref:Uncharacterized protein n=1 Tax=Hymenoscyphus fraxineus TaxID=746836 RepID=A0A9N9PS18_9HELO|nr:hypothetical protein HYFRA_00006594 [Hymenoscyphus fraxineus]